MMTISFLIPHLKIAGGTRIILTYAAFLAKHGHKVTVYVVNPSPWRRALANILGLRPGWISGFDADVIRVSKFSTATVLPADVLIATTYKTALMLGNFPQEHGRQYYLLQHDEGLYHGPRDKVDEAYRLPQKKIVVATWLGELLREKYEQDSTLLLNPIDKKQFSPRSRTVNDGTIRVGLLHHTYDWKGTREGAEAIMGVKKKHPEVRLILFGVRKEIIDTPYDEYHYDLPQEKLAEFYSNLDIFLCPSWDEGFGLPSLEAMACGAALVTYDNGGSRDFAIDGKTALVAPHRDKITLVKKLEELVANLALRKQLAEEGKSFVGAMAGWEEQTEKLENILSDGGTPKKS